jgi:cytochrome c oxidase subunit 3
MAQTSVSADPHEQPASPVLFGTILFLASDLLLFGGLFAAYFGLRSETNPWPPAGVHLETGLAAVATALLVVSSFTFHAGLVAGGRGRMRVMRNCIALTFLLGAGFVTLQVTDYLRLNFQISSHAYGTLYWTMTGMHGLHVVGGLILMLVVLARLSQGAYEGGTLAGPHAMSYYWHFVDIAVPAEMTCR